MKRRTRRTIVDRLMNEVILYGGLPLRRCDVAVLAAEHLGDDNTRGRFGSDWFAFGPNTTVVDVEPIDLNIARELMK